MQRHFNKVKILDFMLIETNEVVNKVDGSTYVLRKETYNEGSVISFNGESYYITSDIDYNKSQNGLSKLFFTVKTVSNEIN